MDLILTAPRKLSFREFVNNVRPGYKWYRHCRVLARVLQRVAERKIKRLMVFIPPRHGKSELVSRLFSAYWLYLYGHQWVALSSYGAELAHGLSRNAREHYIRSGANLKGDAAAVKHWETGKGGGLWACGVNGPATGKGWHLGIIDDPIKDAKEAGSRTIREGVWDWFGSVFLTREEPDDEDNPDGALIVVQTRWHPEDLAGKLLAAETSEDDPEDAEHWHIVNLAAISEEMPQPFPATCTVEPDWREPGEALCPERRPLHKLRRILKRIGSYFFNALFQQRPAPAVGEIFKREWWRFWKPAGVHLPPVTIRMPDGETRTATLIDLPNAFDEEVLTWDMTFKDNAGSDNVSGQNWKRKGADVFLDPDEVYGKYSFTATLTEVRKMAERHPNASAILIEDKANGTAVMDTLRHEISGLIAVEPDGGKVARAQATTPFVEAGNVYLPHPAIAPWVLDWIEDFTFFPKGKYDDRVDAATQGIRRLLTGVGRYVHAANPDPAFAYTPSGEPARDEFNSFSYPG